MNIIICFHSCSKYTEEMLFILTFDIIFFWLKVFEVLLSVIHVYNTQCFANHCRTVCLLYWFQFAKNLIGDGVIV